jgi:hypothetical protein
MNVPERGCVLLILASRITTTTIIILVPIINIIIIVIIITIDNEVRVKEGLNRMMMEPAPEGGTMAHHTPKEEWEGIITVLVDLVHHIYAHRKN